MKFIFSIIIAASISGCSTPHKPCAVEALMYRHRDAAINFMQPYCLIETEDQKDARLQFMADTFKTIAELENETGHYK